MDYSNTAAARLHDLTIKQVLAEDEVFDALLVAAGCDPTDHTTWIAGDYHHDHYDNSFELVDVNEGWLPSEETCLLWQKIGFSHCWLNYKDDTEIHIGFDPKLSFGNVTKRSWERK